MKHDAQHDLKRLPDRDRQTYRLQYAHKVRYIAQKLILLFHQSFLALVVHPYPEIHFQLTTYEQTLWTTAFVAHHLLDVQYNLPHKNSATNQAYEFHQLR